MPATRPPRSTPPLATARATPPAPSPARSTPTPAAQCDLAVDLGDPGSEACHRLRGWGRVTTDLLAFPEDGTARLQTLRGEGSLEFPNVAPGRAYHLTLVANDGRCDDSFDIVVAGRVLGEVRAEGGNDLGPRRHTFRIPGGLVDTDRLTVTFRNVATDRCGLAGIYGVRLDPA